MDEQEKLALLKRVERDAGNYLERCTVPLLYADPVSFRVIGTCVLFAIAETYFAITAGHVAEEAGKCFGKLPIYIPTNRNGEPFVHLRKLTCHYTERQPDSKFYHDVVDLGYLIFDRETSAQLASCYHFIRFQDVDFRDAFVDNSMYILFGFPGEDIHTSHSSGTFTYKPTQIVANLYRDERGPLDTFDPAINVAFHFHESVALAWPGRLFENQDPSGMSGCGIWRIVRNLSQLGEWTVDDMRLVGIEHTWNWEAGALIGSRIGYVLRDITVRFPDLKAAIDSTLFFSKDAIA